MEQRLQSLIIQFGPINNVLILIGKTCYINGVILLTCSSILSFNPLVFSCMISVMSVYSMKEYRRSTFRVRLGLIFVAFLIYVHRLGSGVWRFRHTSQDGCCYDSPVVKGLKAKARQARRQDEVTE